MNGQRSSKGEIDERDRDLVFQNMSVGTKKFYFKQGQPIQE
jgi:hypothetical protein